MKLFKVCLCVCVFSISSHINAKKYEYHGSCNFTGDMEKFEQCLDKELVIYDRKLNELYRGYFLSIPDKRLKKAEALWVKFKEADCDYMAGEVHGGQYYDYISKACLINMTKARIEDLNRSFLFFGWFDNGESNK